MHLYSQPKKTKDGVIGYYSLATSVKDVSGAYRRKIVHRLGRLTDEQADTYRAVLKSIDSLTGVDGLCSIDEIVYKEDRRYFDVLVLSTLWDQLEIDRALSSKVGGRKKISTSQVARILTINRLLAPASKIKTIDWLATTLLPKIMGCDPNAYRKTKIFDELGRIHEQKPALERHFAAFSARQRSDQCEVFFFDGTTSWFEGNKCELAKLDLEKTRGIYPKVVSLMLVTDKLGYPIAWDAVDGNTKDTSCFAGLAKRIRDDYGIREITYCFDRGVASTANFNAAAAHDAKFISGIKDNQISAVFDLDRFEKVRQKIFASLNSDVKKEARRVVDIDGFLTRDRNIFFKDLGVVDGMRYVASFNVEAYNSEQEARNKRLTKCLAEIALKNCELKEAKRDRAFDVTERDLIDILNRHKMRSVVEYVLYPITPANSCQSLEIKCSLNKQKLQEQGRTDGLLIYITDHTALKKSSGIKEEFKLHASEIIAHYKSKHIIENAFREMKSFLALRPFHVWTEEHVKAHYDIAVIAYFINNHILQCLGGVSDTNCAKSLRDFYRQIESASNTVRFAAPNGIEITKMKPLSADIVPILKELGLSALTHRSLHTSYGVYQ